MPATLEAVNRVLSAVALRPVSTLEGQLAPMTVLAARLVDEEDRAAQQERWHFQVEPDVTLQPGGDGRILLGPSILTWADRESRHIAIRAEALYDLEEGTDIFTRQRRGELVRRVAFEETPPTFQEYVAQRAARRMHAQYRGDPAGQRDAVANEQRMRTVARNADLAMGMPVSADSHAISRITFRPPGRRIW